MTKLYPMILNLTKNKELLLLTKEFLGQLFSDPTKFEDLNEDPTLRNLSTFQKQLNALKLMDEIIVIRNGRIVWEVV